MDVDGVDMCWMLGTRKYYINMYQTLTNGSDMQVATKEILRFEALWLKHFKDTRGDVLKERRCMLLPHVLILGWRLCCCLISVASECLDLTMWNTGSFRLHVSMTVKWGEAKCRTFYATRRWPRSIKISKAIQIHRWRHHQKQFIRSIFPELL